MKWFALLLCAHAWGQVSYDRIVNAASEPGNWLTYSGNYQGHRFSPLSQITPANVGNLRVKWAYQMDYRAEVSPIVVDGVMYVTGPNTAAALDTPHRPRVVDVEAAHSEGLPEHRIRPRESRPGHPGRPDLRRHARLLPGCARREERPRTMVVQGGGLQARIQHDAGAAGHSRQGTGGRERRRNRHSRLRGCLRRENRQPCLALLHHSRPGRTGTRDLARR